MANVRFIEEMERSDGFTLIEVLISLAIFSIGLLAVASMQLSSAAGNRSARQLGETSAIASAVVEQIMNTPFENVSPTIPAVNNDGIDNDRDGFTDEPDEEAEFYSVSWAVTDNDVYDGTKTVVVTVRDHSRRYNGKWRSLSVTTVVSNIFI